MFKKTAKVICGWCGKEFKAKSGKTTPKEGEGFYLNLFCLYCGRSVCASVKESTGSFVGRKHIHRDLKDGDIV